MKRLLLTTDLLFFLASSATVYLYFYISPIKNDQPDRAIIIFFLTTIFISIATGVTLLLYSPHLILRRMRHTGLTKKFLWKEVFITSLRRGVLLGLLVISILLLHFYHQGGIVNSSLASVIFLLMEVYFSRK